MSVLHQRIEYETAGLDVAELAADPIEQWWVWFNQANAAGCTEPTAMTVATVDDAGVPDARLVLAKDVDSRGFSFFTNYGSAKSRQITQHPVACCVFGWLQLHRQVRVRGSVVRVDESESDTYFASRPRGSQIGGWASPQSEVLPDRAALHSLVEGVEARFEGLEIPRPAHWGGWRVVPDSIEFWQGRPSRLHDRLRYRRDSPADPWLIERLAP